MLTCVERNARPCKDVSVTEPESAADFAAEVDESIGRNVRAAREARGISQAELARLTSEVGITGFHQTTVARIESGKRALRAAEGIALARVLETSLETLAESSANTRARSHLQHLGQASIAFDAAARELLHARLLAAQHLDEVLPYAEDGEAPFEMILQSGIEPMLYESLEQRIVSASPASRLEDVIFNEAGRRFAYDRRGAAPSKQRVEFLMDEYLHVDDVGTIEPEDPLAGQLRNKIMSELNDAMQMRDELAESGDTDATQEAQRNLDRAFDRFKALRGEYLPYPHLRATLERLDDIAPGGNEPAV